MSVDTQFAKFAEETTLVARDLSPHSIDAERSVLGGILVDNAQLDEAQALVAPEQFFRTAHQHVYRATLTLAARKMPVDLVTVVDHLRQIGELDACGGPSYVASLIDGVPSAMNVPYYARLVKTYALKRALIASAHRLISSAQQSDATLDELVDVIESELTALRMAQPSDLTGGPVLSSEASAWLEDVAQRATQGRMSGISTGLYELDVMTDGLQPGDLIVIAARPGQGKTALSLQFALASDGPAAFFSLEMRRAQLAARALAWLARVDGWAMRRGRLTSNEYERVSHALTQLAESGLAIDDAFDLTVHQIRSKARRWKAQHGLSLVIVDYLQLVTPPRDKKQQRTREQDVAAMTRMMKALAKDLQVPVIILAQLNRAVEGRADAEPKLSDLRESGAVEQDADLVMFLHRPGGKSVSEEGDAHLMLSKHRNGPTGTIKLWWTPSQTRFASVAVS